MVTGSSPASLRNQGVAHNGRAAKASGLLTRVVFYFIPMLTRKH